MALRLIVAADEPALRALALERAAERIIEFGGADASFDELANCWRRGVLIGVVNTTATGINGAILLTVAEPHEFVIAWLPAKPANVSLVTYWNAVTLRANAIMGDLITRIPNGATRMFRGRVALGSRFDTHFTARFAANRRSTYTDEDGRAWASFDVPGAELAAALL